MFSGDAKIVSLLSVSVTIGTILGSLTFAKMKEEKKNTHVILQDTDIAQSANSSNSIS